MVNEENGTNSAANANQSGTPSVASIGSVGQSKGEPHPPEPEAKQESSADKAAKSTARATWVIAGFTVVLALVGTWTLIEVISGGDDTKKLAQAAVDQATALKIQAQNTENLATAARNQAGALSEQVQKLQASVSEMHTLAKAAQDAVAASKIQSDAALKAGVEASNNQLAVLRTQIDSEERPWIEVRPPIASSALSIRNGTAEMEIAFVLRNVGHSAAWTQINPQLYFFDAAGPNPRAPAIQQDSVWCGPPDPGMKPPPVAQYINPRAMSLVLFPGNTNADSPLHIRITSPIPPDSFRQPKAMLIGCVAYKHLDRQQFKNTGFIYSIEITEGVPTFKDGDIPVERLRLDRWPLGGDFAR